MANATRRSSLDSRFIFWVRSKQSADLCQKFLRGDLNFSVDGFRAAPFFPEHIAWTRAARMHLAPALVQISSLVASPHTERRKQWYVRRPFFSGLFLRDIDWQTNKTRLKQSMPPRVSVLFWCAFVFFSWRWAIVCGILMWVGFELIRKKWIRGQVSKRYVLPNTTFLFRCIWFRR